MAFPVQLLAEVATFAAVGAATFAAAREIERRILQKRRLGAQSLAGGSIATPLVQDRSVKSPFLRWVEMSTSISDAGERDKLSRELALAGFGHPSAAIWYVIFRFGAAIGLPVAYVMLQSVVPNPATGNTLMLWALILCGMGLLTPKIVLSQLVSARRADIEREFPDALDLMVICVEAGLGLDAAVMRVGQEIGTSHPHISREFVRLSDELRAGRSHAEAMRAMADRTDVSGVKSFVGLVIQTETLGAAVATALRVYASEMRETRMLRAEEKAMRIPVLMTVPLVTCILPVICTAALLPAMIDLMRNVLPALSR